MAAYFNIKKGLSSALSSVAKKEGTVYFTTNDGKLYIDTNSTTRVGVNAIQADTARITSRAFDRDTSNATNLVTIYDTNKTTLRGLVGFHNTGGDGTGSAYIIPYPVTVDPWSGAEGLFIGKGILRIDGAAVLTSSNYSSYTVTKTGAGASGTWGISITGSANNARQVYHESIPLLQYAADAGGVRVGHYTERMVLLTKNDDIYHYRYGTDQDSIVLDTGNYSKYALPLTGGTLSGTLKFSNALTQVSSPTVVATYVDNNSANGLGYASTSALSVGYASNAGYANSAGLLSIHNNLTTNATRSVRASTWTGALSDVSYMWGQAFKDTSIGADTGDLVLALRSGVYTSGGTELCVAIDGDYYSMGNKVLHAGNYTSYTVTKTGSGASGTWGINVTGNAATATKATQDGSGNTITSTYLKLSGGTMTGPLSATSGLTWYSAHWQPVGNITCTPTANNQEWSIDVGNSTYTGSYFHIWSGKNQASILQCFVDDNRVVIPSGTLTTSKMIYANGGITGNLTGNATSATKATQDGNGATISSTYLKRSGGTMTGAITFTGENRTYYKIERNVEGGSGWAYSPFNVQDNNNATFAQIGVYGGGNTLTYMYIGSGNYDSTANLRIYKTGTVWATAVEGAVWNDYAEYRSGETTEPGKVVKECPDGILRITESRLEPGCEIISDTFGFVIGKTDKCETPVATSGRVLAYPFEDRNTFELGQAVCSGPNGTVSKMTREEIMMYPERIIGTVSEIPQYETWGTGNVEINGRIWIRIR